jgi:hypothetical protein
MALYSRKPVVFLSSPARQELTDVEKGKGASAKHEDALDRHVEDLLARPSKIKRTLRGVWSFLKTRMSRSSLLMSSNLTSFSPSAMGVSRTPFSFLFISLLSKDCDRHLWIPRW